MRARDREMRKSQRNVRTRDKRGNAADRRTRENEWMNTHTEGTQNETPRLYVGGTHVQKTIETGSINRVKASAETI